MIRWSFECESWSYNCDFGCFDYGYKTEAEATEAFLSHDCTSIHEVTC